MVCTKIGESHDLFDQFCSLYLLETVSRVVKVSSECVVEKLEVKQDYLLLKFFAHLVIIHDHLDVCQAQSSDTVLTKLFGYFGLGVVWQIFDDA